MGMGEREQALTCEAERNTGTHGTLTQGSMVEKDDRPIQTRDDRGPMIRTGAKGYTVKLAKSENPSGANTGMPCLAQQDFRTKDGDSPILPLSFVLSTDEQSNLHPSRLTSWVHP